MPLRPQTVLIAGASYPLRIIIKTLIMITSVFSKKKVLDRIKFVSSEEALNSIPKASAPVFLGGGGGWRWLQKYETPTGYSFMDKRTTRSFPGPTYKERNTIIILYIIILRRKTKKQKQKKQVPLTPRNLTFNEQVKAPRKDES